MLDPTKGTSFSALLPILSAQDKAKGFIEEPEVSAELWRKAQLLARSDHVGQNYRLSIRLGEEQSIGLFFTNIGQVTIPTTGKIHAITSTSWFEEISKNEAPMGQIRAEIQKNAANFIKLYSLRSAGEIKAALLDDTFNPRVESFDELQQLDAKFYLLRMLERPIGKSYLMCTCPSFAKNAVCKHSIAFSIMGAKIVVPAQFDIRIVGKGKRKRGRPKIIAPALAREADEAVPPAAAAAAAAPAAAPAAAAAAAAAPAAAGQAPV